MASSTGRETVMVPSATAVRAVDALADTSTITAFPPGSKWFQTGSTKHSSSRVRGGYPFPKGQMG